MMKLKKALAMMAFSICIANPVLSQDVNIIPKPNEMKIQEGKFALKNGLSIYAPQNSRARNLLEKKLSTAVGIQLKSVSSEKAATIRLKITPNKTTSKEGYSLQINPRSILITASTEDGLYYGVQTLLQLLPPEIESKTKTTANWQVPCLRIEDSPRFAYRGILLDCCRHFTTVEEIKKLMDVFAMYKINKFHWHLTEDQAWRIEIKKYPKLTSVGGFREENGKMYGGYYTQEQIKDIIRYAADRNIEVIPEIEMPGHALAALSAYPQYSCTGGPFKPRIIWGVEDDVFCAGNEATYTFLESILDEVCALFPSKIVHIGGDECPKIRWKNCPKCQAMIHKNKLKSEEELQSYFTKRIEKYLAGKGKRMFGWDEIMEGGIDTTAMIMSWRGEQGGIDAANAGHDVVMTPNSYLYLDHYQGSWLCEDVKIGGLTTLQKTYSYEPLPKAITSDKAHHILGLQGNLWQEYMFKPNQIEYQLFPKTTAIAEVGWTKADKKNEDSFIRRIDDHQIRWDFHNLNYYIPMPEGNMNFIQFVDTTSLAFSSNRGVKIVYTLDGSEPTAQSTVYTSPIKIQKNTTIKLRSVLPQGKLSPVRTVEATLTKPYSGIANIEDLQKGMRMKYVRNGNLTRPEELTSITGWQDSIVASPNDFFKLKGKEQTGGAAIFTGYIHIEKEGIYTLHCLADQFFLGDKLMISNNKMKKNGKTDITVPMTAGYYPVKIVLLNRQYDGVVSQWVDTRVTIRPAESLNTDTATPVFYK